jgi:hypothetical protein
MNGLGFLCVSITAGNETNEEKPSVNHLQGLRLPYSAEYLLNFRIFR